MADPKPIIYRIHPAIGFARVGGGSQFFIGPEVPGYGATGADAAVGSAVPPYKQVAGTLKRQAARFRVWRYQWASGLNSYVPDLDDLSSTGAKIKWTVEIANRKASFYEFHGTNGEDPGAVFNPRKRNKKVTAARDTKLDVTPGPKSIEGASKGPEKFDFAVPGIPIIYLGELHTDNKGRLIVLGGRGESKQSATLAAAGGYPFPRSLDHYANNPTWFDDVSDGPVTAEIELSSGEKIPATEVQSAWVIAGPPDFAPPLRSVVSLYDTLVDVWVRNALEVSGISGAPVWMRDMKADFNATSGFTNFRPDFVRDVYPILQAVINSRWVHSPAQPFHATFDWAKLTDNSAAREPDRTDVFKRCRLTPSLTSLPAGPANANMPRLIGDEEIDENSAPPTSEENLPDAGAPRRPVSAQPGPKSWLTLTAVQYAVLLQWKKGKFDKGIWPASNKPGDIPAPPATVTPWGLDAAALENCVGGAFYPGIEVGWLIRNFNIFKAPRDETSVFRINPWRRVLDGSVMMSMANKPIRRKIHYGSPGGGEDLQLGAGYFSQQMALPWQADFLSCLKTNHNGVIDAGWWPAQRPDDVHVTTLPLPLSAANLAAYNASLGMEDWAGSTAAAPGPPAIPARSGDIATAERLIAHFQKLGFVRAADAIGDKRPNRETVYLEQERNAIPP